VAARMVCRLARSGVAAACARGLDRGRWPCGDRLAAVAAGRSRAWLGLTLMLPMSPWRRLARAGALWLTVLDVARVWRYSCRPSGMRCSMTPGPLTVPRPIAAAASSAIPARSGIAQLDAMLVTHDDNDHREAPLACCRLPCGLLLVATRTHSRGSRPRLPAALLCRQGGLDGVRFELLHRPSTAMPSAAQIQRSQLRAENCHGSRRGAAHRRYRGALGTGAARTRAGKTTRGCADGAAPQQPHLVDVGLIARCSRAGPFFRRISQPLRPSEGGGGRALSRQRRAHAAHRQRRRRCWCASTARE